MITLYKYHDKKKIFPYKQEGWLKQTKQKFYWMETKDSNCKKHITEYVMRNTNEIETNKNRQWEKQSKHKLKYSYITTW
jgi:hypothetical protein